MATVTIMMLMMMMMMMMIERLERHPACRIHHTVAVSTVAAPGRQGSQVISGH